LSTPSNTGPWKTAPQGGLTWRHDWIALQIWVPEGWKQDREPARDPQNPMGWTPIWYREKGGLGTLRATTLRIRSTNLRHYDPVDHAKAVFEKRKSQPDKESPQVVHDRERSIVSYAFSGMENGIPLRTNVWEIFDDRGVVALSFAYDSRKVGNENLTRELSEVTEIVRRIVHLQIG